MSPDRFVIVNTADAPIRKLVAEWIEDVGYCYMNRTRYPELKRYDGMSPDRPTAMEEFGFKIFVGEDEAMFVPSNPPTATYEDGQPRKWQERFSPQESFSLPLVKGVTAKKHREPLATQEPGDSK